MRPLVETPGSSEEHHDPVNLFLANGIRHQERQSSFLMPAATWVIEDDYEKALEMAQSAAARHGKRARIEWDREWRERYEGWYFRGLLTNIKKPANLIRLLLLLTMLGAFLIYLLIYIIRRG